MPLASRACRLGIAGLRGNTFFTPCTLAATGAGGCCGDDQLEPRIPPADLHRTSRESGLCDDLAERNDSERVGQAKLDALSHPYPLNLPGLSATEQNLSRWGRSRCRAVVKEQAAKEQTRHLERIVEAEIAQDLSHLAQEYSRQGRAQSTECLTKERELQTAAFASNRSDNLHIPVARLRVTPSQKSRRQKVYGNRILSSTEDRLLNLLEDQKMPQSSAAEQWASLLEWVQHQDGKPLNSSFLAFIEACGYNPEAPTTWTTLLGAPNSPQSLAQLHSFCRDLVVVKCDQPLTTRQKPLPLPLQVVETVLSRQDLHPHTVSSYMVYLSLASESMRRYRHTADELTLGRAQLVTWRAKVLLGCISHLARHSRQMWPELLPHVCKLFVQWAPHLWTKRDIRSRVYKSTKIQSDTCFANALLGTLAIRSSEDSLRDIATQLKSQIFIIEYMLSQEPSLELDRRGYQAVASVQLRLPKNKKERRWAMLKAASWPPWIADRDAMECLVQPEEGFSVAIQTLNRAHEAGYGSASWERIARLYGGWDTDLSPTIQTRHYVEQVHRWHESMALWAGRVRVGRNIKECWAAFLAYQDSTQILHPIVCQAMLEKILAEQGRISDERFLVPADQEHEDCWLSAVRSESLLPGDGPRIFPPPSSAHLETYTRTPPPGIKEFVAMMVKAKVRLKDDVLVKLLAQATSMHGLILLRVSSDNGFRCRPRRSLLRKLAVGSLDGKLARAVIGHIMRYRPSRVWTARLIRGKHFVRRWELNKNCLVMLFIRIRPGSGHMLHDMDYADFKDVHHRVLRDLASSRYFCQYSDRLNNTDDDEGKHGQQMREGGLVSLKGGPEATQYLLPFQAHLDRMVALSMVLELDESCQSRYASIGDRQLSDMLSVALQACLAAQSCLISRGARIPARSSESCLTGSNEDLAAFPIDDAVLTISLIRGRFRERIIELLTSGPDLTLLETFRTDRAKGDDAHHDSQSMTLAGTPRLYLVPSIATLASAIRVLGSADDFHGLLQLLRYMREYWPEIRIIMQQQDHDGIDSDGHRSGGRASVRARMMLRSSLVMLRLFLTLGHEVMARNVGLGEMFDMLAARAHDGQTAADPEVGAEIKGIIDSMAKEWGPWPSDGEVHEHIENVGERFIKYMNG